jgi:signal peptidase I
VEDSQVTSRRIKGGPVFRKDVRAANEAGGDSPESPEADEPNRNSLGRGARVLVVAALLVVLIVVFVARIYAIPSGSMEATLHGCPGCTNDRVLVDKVTYRFSTPQPGDIVVFPVPGDWHNAEVPPSSSSSNPILRGLGAVGAVFGMERPGQTDFIKRVVAVGGQIVSCCDARNRVRVNAEPVDEPYIHFDPAYGKAQQEPFGPVLVPPGQLWVMGDNRNDSVDSRALGNGPVPVDSVIGKARWIVFPFSRFEPIGAPQPLTGG